jgi:RNA polymerase sigma-70 factor (ECF subfamily)
MPKSLNKNVCEEHLFSKLYERFAKDLHDFIYYKFGAQYNPEDKVQEAFIKLWNKCKDVPPEKAKSFLFTLVNNATLNAIKHQKIVLNYQKKPVKEHTSVTPEFIFEEKQYLEHYQKALSELPEKQRVAFLLNRAEGKRHKEIAELLGISRKAVEKRIYAAVKTLKEQLIENK